MAFSVSPSVIVREVDASASVPAIATPPAAIAGVFRWGPVNDPVLITSETDLVNRFGKPNDDNYETFFSAADYLAYANALYVVRADDGSEVADAHTRNANGAITSYDGAFEAKYKGELGNSLEVAYVSKTGFESESAAVGDIPQNVQEYAANTTPDAQTFEFNSSSITFQVDDANRITNLAANDVIKIGNNTGGYQEIKLASITETAVDTNGDETSNTDLIEAYDYTLTFATGQKYLLAETNANKVSITKKWEYNSLFNGAPDTDHIHIAVVDSTGDITGEKGAVIEVFENLNANSSLSSTREDGTDKWWKTVIENQSQWIAVTSGQTIDASGSISKYVDFNRTMTGVKTETTATLANLGAAWDELKNANEIDISFIIGGKSDDAATRPNYIISNVAEYRKDCVAFVSPAKSDVVDVTAVQDKLDNVLDWRDSVQNSSYAFMDSGYKYRYDKYSDTYRYTPLNGDMAGLASRVETWESPAGYRKGVIKNVVKLAFNPSKAHRDALYSKDINPVMSQSGQGIILFGDKTGYGVASAFDRLNVRRLFIAVEKAIATAAQGFLFELNDDFTQTQFKNIVDPFLRDIQGRRGIVDFRVVSDSTVNTPAVVDQNKFRANIYIQPARSINVIELTFVATRTGVEFDEIVGSIR